MAANEWCSIVVPCYNEEHRLNLASFGQFLQVGRNVRFLFVNDGSQDGTLLMLKGLQAEAPDRIDVLDMPRNSGKAEAVRAGMNYVLNEQNPAFVGFWDADLATPLHAIPQLLGMFTDRERIQMVFGSRVSLLGRTVNRKPLRHYAGRVFASFVSILLRLPIYDTQCGAKIFRSTDDLKKVLSDPFHSRWIFDVEILARFMALHGNKPEYLRNSIYEYPLNEWHDVSGSKVGLSAFFRAGIELTEIWNDYLREG